MTKQGEYRTASRALTLTFRRDLPVPGLEQPLLRWFEAEEARGVRFSAGQTVQFGWSTLRLTQRADGSLGVLEPDLQHELKWLESVDQAAFQAWQQKEVLSSLDLVDRADFPRQALHAVVCERVFTAGALMLGRTEASAPTDSGWFVGCTDEAHDHQHEAALTIAPLVELAARLPRLVPWFALPAGVDVLLPVAARARPRIFVDGEERAPREGSHLATLDRAD